MRAQAQAGSAVRFHGDVTELEPFAFPPRANEPSGPWTDREAVREEREPRLKDDGRRLAIGPARRRSDHRAQWIGV
jgi:hypothetical protein